MAAPRCRYLGFFQSDYDFWHDDSMRPQFNLHPKVHPKIHTNTKVQQLVQAATASFFCSFFFLIRTFKAQNEYLKLNSSNALQEMRGNLALVKKSMPYLKCKSSVTKFDCHPQVRFIFERCISLPTSFQLEKFNELFFET